MAVKEPEPKVSARATQAAHEAIENIGARSAEAEQRLRDASLRANERAQEMAGDVTDYVNKNPLTAIGIAAAAGFLLGTLLRR